MIVLQHSIATHILKFNPNKLYQKLSKKYPQIIYYNEFDESYNGMSFDEKYRPFDGISIKDIIKGDVIEGFNNIEEKIKFKMNVQIFHDNIIFFEIMYDTNYLYDEFYKEDTELKLANIKIKTSDNKTISVQEFQMRFIIEDIMHMTTISEYAKKLDSWDDDSKRKMKNYTNETLGVDLKYVGNTAGLQVTVHSYDLIIYDENNIVDINIFEKRKISNSEELYFFNIEEIYYCKNKTVFEKVITDTRINFISDSIYMSNSSIASNWLSEISDKSVKVLDQLKNDNEVYWQNLRMEIEEWQLSFLSMMSDYFSLFYLLDNKKRNKKILNKEQSKNLDEISYNYREKSIHLFNEVKYALENLATPGHTHDEQLLQKETEKGNERILLLSFLAMSIPLIGAILTPSITTNLKFIAGIITLSLPVSYLFIRKYTFKRKYRKNTKKNLLSTAKELSRRIKASENFKEQIRSVEDMSTGMIKYLEEILDKQKKLSEDQLVKIKKKIKSL